MRTFEQILEDDYHIQLEDNRRDESMKLAAEKYVAQKQVPTDKEMLFNFCKFIGNEGYKINGYDDTQLRKVIEYFKSALQLTN